MQLTSYTDYSLRVLLYLGTQPENQLSSIKEISSAYGISNNHLSKIVFELGKLGLIETIRGRNGGIKLAKQPKSINIGAVVRQTEDLQIVECFNEEGNLCIISSGCRLKHVLNDAMKAFLKVLDSYTLEDILINKDYLRTLLPKV
ncbi:Rrf2 family transcriptional regulator [Alkalihalobacterium alkalinitrilicum]|uniref:Rrf2 family transcriptional regulator n=1 Tax=Alkalihalobacterium alkalinitrilicum TaxID=427920 RepID=UPI00099578BB|nr:Rrf2 family transcriptional regulator [Alkalihalobacterium alkalinitrilicum]